MDSQETLPLTEIDMQEEIRLTVYHLRAFLKSHLKLARPGSPSAAVSEALAKHLRELTPADLGLPSVWSERSEHAARIEGKALAEAAAEGLAGDEQHERTA